MILLDSDHATFLKYPDSERGRRMMNRLTSLPESEIIGVTIIIVEERMRGWLAVIAKEKTAQRQVVGYRELTHLFQFFKNSKSQDLMRLRRKNLTNFASRSYASVRWT